MLEYFWIMIFLIEGLDMASLVARLEMYKEIKYLSADQRREVPLGLYSSICFYLIPDDGLIKFTKRFPLTYLFDRKIKNMLKDKTYEGESILKRLDAIKNIKWNDIKDKAIHVVMSK